MNKFIITSLMVLASAALLSAAPARRLRGGALAAQGSQQSGTSIVEQEAVSEALSANEKGLSELRALLQAEQARNFNNNERAERKDRRNKGKAFNFGDRIQAESILNFETIDNQAEFNNLEADADVSSANKFALSLMSEDRYDESASIVQNNGRQSQTGTKLNSHDILDSETLANEHEFDQSDFFEGSLLSQSGASQDALNAGEESRTEHAASIDAQKSAQQNNAFQEGFGGVFGGSFGSSSPFGGSLFGSQSLGGGLSLGQGNFGDLYHL